MKKLLMVIPLALILCFMVGCQDKEAMAELEKFRAQVEVEEQNKEIVLRLIKETDKKNFDLWDELCSPDFVATWSGSTDPFNLEQWKDVLIQWDTIAFPDFKHEVLDVIAEGDKVSVYLNVKGTHQGEAMGVSATGNKVSYDEIIIYRIAEGKVMGLKGVDDFSTLMQQLGMELKPKEWEK